MTTLSPGTPPGTRSDGALVGAAQGGDRAAFVELYERYFNRVFDFALRMTRDRDEAADVAQESFIRALERIGSLDDGERFKSWIFAIARNQALDRLRRSQRVRPLTVRGDDGESEPIDVIDPDRLADPAAAAEANAVASLVWEAAAGLDARQFSVLELHVRQGLSSAEIAEVMGVTRNNGYVMLNRLKEAVQSTVEALLLMREGSAHCDALAGIVRDAETETMTPDLRRAIARHASRCDACAARKRSLVSPLAVLAALAPVPPATALSAETLERVLEHAPDDAAAGDISSALAAFIEDDGELSTLTRLDAHGPDTVGRATWLDAPSPAAIDEDEVEPEW